MHNIFSSFSTPSKIDVNNGDNNSTIFYNFVGNFIPPEWSTLSSHNGKILSKTSRQLLSLIVFRLQIYYNNSIDELQETYHFFEEHLGVCQERVRQCLIELEKSGFIKVYKATIIKYGIKCRNTILNMVLNAAILLVLSWLEISNLLLAKYHLKMKKILHQLQKTLG